VHGKPKIYDGARYTVHGARGEIAKSTERSLPQTRQVKAESKSLSLS